jgi:stage V sporulation protein B
MTSERIGTVGIFVAKFVFVASGYLLIISLTRLMDPSEFGVYSVVFGAVALVNMVVINGTIQAVSRFVAQRPGHADALRRKAFLYQLALTGIVLAAVWLGAVPAARWLNDPALVPYLRLSIVITGIYACYAINVGYLNGKRRFLAQAALDITFSILKVSLILILVALGHGLHGVIAGFAGAAALVLLLSFLFSGVGLSGPSVDLRASHFLTFAFSVMTVALVVNMVMQADLFMLKRLSPVAIADENAGFYGAAQQIARIPYYLMVTASLVAFPIVAGLRVEDREGRRRRADAVSQTFTAVLVIVAGMAAVSIPISARILHVFFPAAYAVAAPALAWLIAALAALTLVSVCVNMMSGGGRPGVATALLVFALLVQVTVAAWLIPSHGLVGAAMATAAASAGCLVACASWLRSYFAMRVARRIFVVVPLAVAVIASLSEAFDRVAPEGALVTVLYAACAYSLYLGLCAAGGVLLGARAYESRVLLVTKPLAPPYNDAAKVVPRAILGHLEPVRTAVLSTRAGKIVLESELPGIEVAPIYWREGSLGARRLENALVFFYLIACRFHFGTLHFFFAPNPGTCRAIKLIRAISPGVRFVQTVLSRPRSYDGARGLLFGDAVTAGSLDTVRRLREATGREIELVRLGIPSDVTPRPRDEVLKDYGLPLDTFHLVFAGDIDHGGALQHLERVVPGLLRAHEGLYFHLSVRTKGPRTMARARAFYDRCLAPFEARVCRWIDHRPFQDLLDLEDAMLFAQEHLYAKMDAPLVILETMLRGRPVFMLDRPPLEEIVPPALRQRLLAADDEGLMALVGAHLAAPSRIDGEALSARVRELFDVRLTAAAYRKIHGRP